MERQTDLQTAAHHPTGSRSASSDGTWRFKSLHVDGEQVPIEQPLFMDISNDGFSASTTCNTVSGDFGSDIMTTLVLCGDEDARTSAT